MACTVNSQQCDYLRSPTTSYVFASERAELAHTNEQISSLDNHISQLNTLRAALHRRSCQLHNLLSPVRVLPVEVVSRIFKQVIDSVEPGYYGHDPHRVCLRQALVLSSVTTHFRYVAFGTPELWKKIPLALRGTGAESTNKASALLQHCVALSSNVDISISDKLKLKGQVSSAINVLLDPGTTRKIKAFRLFSAYAPKVWVEKLKISSFPMLDTLTINYNQWKDIGFDYGAFNSIALLSIPVATQGRVSSPSIIPPLQRLKIIDVPQQVLVSLLYHYPNLVDCNITIENRRLLDGTKFTKPLILSYLKQLTFGIANALGTLSSAQNFQLPSLEYLYIRLFGADQLLGVILLCRNVSATLTTLTITTASETLDYDDLFQLCRLPFPNLIKLEFRAHVCYHHRSPLSNVVRALTPLNVGSNNSQPPTLPSLCSLSLCSNPNVEPLFILDMLEKWRVGETSHFHLDVSHYATADDIWPPELLEELRWVVGSRQVEVTWNGRKVLQTGEGVPFGE